MRAGARDTSSCPICARGAPPLGQNQAFPFCSAQCKLIDLGRWLDGAYRVPGVPVDGVDGGDGDDGIDGGDGSRFSRREEEG